MMDVMKGLLIAMCVFSLAAAKSVYADDCVILLHGLARTDHSMEKMASGLAADGYRVVNVDYPARKATIEVLVQGYVVPAVEAWQEGGPVTIHFVTHSMGGILVRYYLGHQSLAELGRVVMLSPPNKGSEIVDTLGNVPGFNAFNGPAGQQLGTGASSVPNQLGSAHYPVGIITGNKSINLILSMLIPGDDDGKVSVERARLDGMAAFLVVPHSHPMIMKSNYVIRQTRYFLRYGRFEEVTR